MKKHPFDNFKNAVDTLSKTSRVESKAKLEEEKAAKIRTKSK